METDILFIVSIAAFIVLMFASISIQSSLKQEGAIYASEFMLLIVASLAFAWAMLEMLPM
jgi:hypothetical protein